MKLYDADAPNPRRVRIFCAEKGIDVPRVGVDLLAGENLGPAFRAKSPAGLVPALELADGTVLFEAAAICRYLEALNPEPNLLGRHAVERALVEGWDRIAEHSGLLAVGEFFRNATPALDDRAVSGLSGFERLPALCERGERRIAAFYALLEQRFSQAGYLAVERYTLADVTAFCAVDFAIATGHAIPASARHTKRWYETCASRPSASA